IKRITGKIACSMLQAHAGPTHLYLNLAKLAVPFFIRGIIPKQVISTGVANAHFQGACKIVVSEELASRVKCHMLQRCFLVEALVRLGLKRSIQLRTRNDTL